MKTRFECLAIAVLACLWCVACQAGEVADYLTQDGRLKEAVSFKTGTIQFLAPPGEEFVIHPSGEWEMNFADLHGKLSQRQLAALAQHLATQDFNSLPKSLGFAPPESQAGYDFVTIGVGNKEAVFKIKQGATREDYLPQADDRKPLNGRGLWRWS